MAQLIETLRLTAAKWRACNQEHREGVVLVWEGEVYGWKNELRDPASERPGVYAVDKAELVFRAVTTITVQKRGSRLTLTRYRKRAWPFAFWMMASAQREPWGKWW